MSREALLAGKHVLVEKPMAMNAAEVADLFGLAAAQGVFLMEAMWMKFTPGFLRARARTHVLQRILRCHPDLIELGPDDGNRPSC